MARWPSMHARLKGMKPHLPPKKDDNKPTLGKYTKSDVKEEKKMTNRESVCVIVLDLDETLLHTYREDTSGDDVDYVIFAKDGSSCLLAGTLRPGALDFLKWAASIFEVVVWTAGREDYASMVRNCLDPEGRLIT